MGLRHFYEKVDKLIFSRLAKYPLPERLFTLLGHPAGHALDDWGSGRPSQMCLLPLGKAIQEALKQKVQATLGM